MKPRALLATIILAVLIAVPTMASAAALHYFDCDQCHRDGAAWNTVDAQGVCITCHDAAGGNYTFPRTQPDTGATSGTIPPGFSTGDASDAFGHGNAPTAQNSHNWGAPDRNPAAGASPASSLMYSARRGAANGFVACYKCHDPHSVYDADYATGNEKMLRTVNIGDGTSTNSEQNVEAMCTECHLDWASVVSAERGLKSHPLDVADYEALAAGDPRFKSFVPTGSMTLLAGNKMGCSTCHGLHGTDSGGANDGKILKASGASIDDLAICTACHEYQAHPTSGAPGTEFGCLTCHSGHSYNNGTPNYFVLRDEIAIPAGTPLPTAGTTVTGLRYSDPNDPDGQFATYCTGCHGSLTDTSPNGISELEDHSTGHQQCSLCHEHYNAASPGDSFSPGAGGGCTSCHGAPPRTTAAGGPDGYADNGTFNYLNDGPYKDESLTPHATHALAGGNPIASSIGCATCHTSYPATHNAGSFQNALEAADTKPALVTANGILSPLYTQTGNGSCDAVYCHSNGGAYNAGGKVLADYTTTAVSWGGANGTINDCVSCHDDNTSGIGGAGPKNNSPAHDAHVTRYDAVDVAGSSCNLCHSQTTDGSTITGLSSHVDGTVQFVTDSAFVIDTVSGATLGGSAGSAASCAVYCHSDGNGNFSNPSWDGAAACGSCHSVDPATIDTLQGGGQHFLHLSDPNGPGAIIGGDCSVCHTHDGTFAPNNGHIDKSKLVKADACDTCHGKPAGGWTAAGTVDESPAWTDPTTVRCDTCHSGEVAVINAVPAPLVAETAYANGHGKAGVAQACTDCHEANTVAGHLGGATIDRTIAALGYTAADDRAFCNACHATSNNNHNSIDGTVCKTCHAQHGEANGFDAMIKSSIAGNTVTGFATQGVRTSYVNASNTGVCQTCHTTALHFSQTLYEEATHNPGQPCSDCHTHTSAPAFTGIGDSCDSCHGYPPNTDAHAVHAPDSFTADGLGKVYRDGTNGFADVTACVKCHTGADSYTYQPSVDRAGSLNHGNAAGRLTILTTTVNYNSGNGSCGVGACHQADATRANWATGFTFPAACDACHGNPPATGGGDGSAHVDHISAGLVCGTCHDSTPADTTHINTFTGATELARVTSMTNALAANVSVTEASWVANADGTCSTAACHDPSGTGFAADWSASISNGNCALCHVDTTGDPTTGSHTAHRTTPNNYTADIACSECHTVPVSTAHRDGTVDVPLDGALATGGAATAGGTVYNSGTGTCSAVYCHDGGLFTTAPSYSDPGADITPVWGDAAYLGGTIADCAQCHDNPPNPAKAAPAHPNNSNCNACHFNVVATTNDGFTDSSLHVNGVVLAEGGTACDSCHNVADIDGALGGVHDSHADIAAFFVGKEVPNGDYGGADWWSVTYTNGKPAFGCGMCHPANEGTGHPANGLNVDLDPGQTGASGVKLLNAAEDLTGVNSRISVTCSTVYCHSDGAGTYKNTLTTIGDWYGGTGQMSGNCDECHGNWPTTNAHGSHQLGIHMDDIYTGSTGLLTGTGPSDPVVHGSGTMSTLSCQTCHNGTVSISFNDNADVCVTCHTGPLGGNPMVVNTSSITHVNGTKNVVFEPAVFTTKAQIRDDITTVADVNSYWSRTTYKQAGSVDTTKANLDGGWNGTTCTTAACHNGNVATWTDSGVDCTYCHTDLSQ